MSPFTCRSPRYRWNWASSNRAKPICILSTRCASTSAGPSPSRFSSNEAAARPGFGGGFNPVSACDNPPPAPLPPVKFWFEGPGIFLLRPMGVRFWNFYSKGPEIADVGVYVAAVQGFNAVGAMTPNEGIQLANELLGTTIEKINEPWADYPFPMVMEILRQGMLTGIEDLEK